MAAPQLVKRSLLMGVVGLLLSRTFAAKDKSGWDDRESVSITYDRACHKIGADSRARDFGGRFRWYNCVCPRGTMLRSHPERVDTTDCDAGNPQFIDSYAGYKDRYGRFQVLDGRFQVFEASEAWKMPSTCACSKLYGALPPTAAEKAQAEAAKKAQQEAEAAKIAENVVLRAQNDVLKGQNDVLKAQNDVLQGQNDVLKGLNDALKAQNDVLQGQNDVMKEHNDVLKAQNDVLQGQNDVLKGKNDVLRAQNDVLKGEAVAALAKQAEQDEKIASAKAKLQHVTKVLTDMTTNL